MSRAPYSLIGSALLLVVSCSDDADSKESALDAAVSDADDGGSQSDSTAPVTDGATDSSQTNSEAGAPLSGACTGQYRIVTEADVEHIRGCTSIAFLNVSQGATFTSLDLPNVTSIGTLGVDLSNKGKVTALNFPALQTIEKSADIRNAPSIKQADFSALKTVGEGLTLSYTGLKEWTLPELTSTGTLNLNTTTDLLSVSFPKLTTAKRLTLDELLVATSVDFPVLRTVDTSVFINKANKLTSCSFPALTTIGESLDITSNQTLAAISFPMLNKVGAAFTIKQNPLLPTCRAQAVRAQLANGVGTVTISGNNDSATCP